MPLSPNNRNNKVPITGRLLNLASHDGDGTASQGVANMFLDDYSQNEIAPHPLGQA